MIVFRAGCFAIRFILIILWLNEQEILASLFSSGYSQTPSFCWFVAIWFSSFVMLFEGFVPRFCMFPVYLFEGSFPRC